MKLSELRTEVFNRADWAPSQSAEAKARVDGFINSALKRLLKDAPSAFFEREFRFSTRDDAEPESTSDTISQANNVDAYDPWVLIRDVANSSLASASLWETNGMWRGRTLIVKVGDRWFEHRIRDIFNRTYAAAEGGDDATHQYISLYEPVPVEVGVSTGYSAVTTWYIVDKQQWMPPNVVRVMSMRLHRAAETIPLEPLSQKQAETLYLKDTPNMVGTGRPRAYFKWDRFEMPTPTQAPGVSATADSWQDLAGSDGTMIEPPGAFEYCFTYCWGYRDPRNGQPSPGSILGGPGYGGGPPSSGLMPEPLWESEPSPSVAFTSLAAPVGTNDYGDAALLTFPDIEAIQGFASAAVGAYAAPLRGNRSGWRIRVYRKRTATVLGLAAGVARTYATTAPNISDRFHFLAELPAATTSWTDDGANAPDYFRPLQANNGSFGYGLYPRPDSEYDVVVRAILRWEDLEDDTDAPPVDEAAEEALIEYALHLLANAEEKPDAGQAAFQRYKLDCIPTLRSIYGPDTPGDTIHRRRPARARHHSFQRKWWNTSS